MRLKLDNRTEYPDAEVRAIIRFACKGLEDLGTLPVKLGYTRTTKARARWVEQDPKYAYGVSGFARYGDLSVSLRIARADAFPVRWHDRGYAGPTGHIGMLADWREGLVAIAAHEARHIEDFIRLGGPREQKARGTTHADMEARCDAFAAERVRAWRAR